MCRGRTSRSARVTDPLPHHFLTLRWQVDEHSTEYYSFGNDPARHTKLSRAAKRRDAASDQAPGNAGAQPPLSASHGAQMPRTSLQSPAPGASADASRGMPWGNPSFSHAGHTGPAGDQSIDYLGPASAAGSGAVTPLAGEDSPPPMGPGSRRSRAR